MKKKLDTRFPAARIKKIMQADEDVGKIAMAVPLLVSKALELFLQDLCNQTHEITLRKGAKTINSLHLKQCVQNFNVFDFLREIVGKVPDLVGSDTAGDDHSCPKRRKVVDGENDTDNESKRSQGNESIHAGITPRGKGKGRGRGRGRGTRGSDRDMPVRNGKLEDYGNLCEHDIDYPDRADDLTKSKENVSTIKSEELPSRNFDLNLDLDENGDSKPVVIGNEAGSSVVIGNEAGSSADTNTEEKQEEYPGWSLSEVENMAIDPLQLANFNSRVEYEEDDYDEEG